MDWWKEQPGATGNMLISSEVSFTHTIAVWVFNHCRSGYTAVMWFEVACYTGAIAALKRGDRSAARNWLRAM